MIKEELSKKILIIGSDIHSKGGISMLIHSHSLLFERFNFIATYSDGGLYKKVICLMKALLLFLSHCFKKDIKIIHIHTASYMDFYRNSIFIYIAKIFRKKVILHIHGGKFQEFYEQKKKFVTHICRKADMLISVSQYFVNFLKKEKLNKHVELLHNLTFPPKQEVTRAATSELINFLYVGSINDDKGIFDVLESIAQHQETLKNKMKYHIGGTGNEERLNKFIQEYNLTDIVIYHGWIDKNKKEELYSGTDVYIQPSKFESFGISILEAMSYKIPIISTNVGGIPDLVKENHNGIFVEPGNKEQIFKAISFFIENPAERLRMGNESLKLAKKFFPDNIEDELIRIYNNVITC